jgi:hypothetical protein
MCGAMDTEAAAQTVGLEDSRRSADREVVTEYLSRGYGDGGKVSNRGTVTR